MEGDCMVTLFHVSSHIFIFLHIYLLSTTVFLPASLLAWLLACLSTFYLACLSSCLLVILLAYSVHLCCISTRLSYLFVRVSASPSHCLTVRLSVLIHPPVSPFCPSACLSVSPAVHLTVYPVCLSFYLLAFACLFI